MDFDGVALDGLALALHRVGDIDLEIVCGDEGCEEGENGEDGGELHFDGR
jgi:hypothetical protein